MRARDIKTCVVVAMADAMEVGSVDDVLFDPLYQRVTGFLFEGLNSLALWRRFRSHVWRLLAVT